MQTNLDKEPTLFLFFNTGGPSLHVTIDVRDRIIEHLFAALLSWLL